MLYPEVKIIVADDSKKVIANELADEYYHLSYDVGVSAGRNFLISKVETKYAMFIDDDTLFIEESRLEKAMKILEENQIINMVAGAIKGSDFYGTMEIVNGDLIRSRRKHRSIIKGHKIYDFDIQLFICRTDFIKRNMWNPELKTVEHMEFFWRIKDNLVLTRVPDMYFKNTSIRNKEYSKLRMARASFYMDKQCSLIGVRKIGDKR